MEKKVMTSLEDEKVLVVGRGSGIARAIADAARRTGATVVTAGRHPEELAEAYDGDPQVSAEPVVSTASARARGLLADLERDAVRRSFDTKVIGPLMLARAFRDQINDDGSLVIFSGVAAFDIGAGDAGRRHHQRRRGHADALARGRTGADPRQRDLPRRRRHRRLGRARRRRQGEAVRCEARAQPGAPDRHARGHR